MVGVEEVESVLRQSLDPSELEVLDISGGCGKHIPPNDNLFFKSTLLSPDYCSLSSLHSPGASFELRIKSPKFNGIKLLDRHRLINEALAPLMDKIHAVSIKQAAPTTTS